MPDRGVKAELPWMTVKLYAGQRFGITDPGNDYNPYHRITALRTGLMLADVCTLTNDLLALGSCNPVSLSTVSMQLSIRIISVLKNCCTDIIFVSLHQNNDISHTNSDQVIYLPLHDL